MKSDLIKLEDWADKCNLAMNPAKTKCIVISTKQMSTAHSLDSFKSELSINGTSIERASSTQLLGTSTDQHLCWEENIKQVSSSCYATLATLRKLKNILPFNIRKTLVQALVLSKLYFVVSSIIIYRTIWLTVIKECKKLQQVSFWDILRAPTTSSNSNGCQLRNSSNGFSERQYIRQYIALHGQAIS